MEIALDPRIPTYSGGLGILGGDTIRSAADLEIPMVAVTLVHRQGYFGHRLDADGNQAEYDDSWDSKDHLERLGATVELPIEGRPVKIGVWRYTCSGATGHSVPVYLLDAAFAENSPQDQALTDHLYGGDDRYRLCQEAILGMGGVAVLEILSHTAIRLFHMNEGHSSLLVLGLLRRLAAHNSLAAVTAEDIEAVRRRCVFTTHTPVPAGHDQFSRDLMRRVLGDEAAHVLHVTQCCPDELLNMTFLALRCSHFINGVAMRHGEVSQGMFPNYPISAITNGVHAVTWIGPEFARLFDAHIPQWRLDNLHLRYVMGIPLKEIRRTHQEAKQVLFDRLQSVHCLQLDETAFTIGFARRSTSYKRADLVFHNLERLRWMARNIEPFQIVIGGKAIPKMRVGRTSFAEFSERRKS